MIEYRITEAEGADVLAAQVNYALGNNWTPCGGVAVFQRQTYCGYREVYAQALIRHHESPAPSSPGAAAA